MKPPSLSVFEFSPIVYSEARVPHSSEWPDLIAGVSDQQAIAVVLAQSDPDVLADIGGAFKNFYDSGQIWALIVGIVIGYVVRGITTYR